jgi:hypothetical protein
MGKTAQPVPLASLSDRQREQAMARFAVIQPHLDGWTPPSTARSLKASSQAERPARPPEQSEKAS